MLALINTLSQCSFQLMYIKLLYRSFNRVWHRKLLRENDANSIFTKTWENVAQILPVMTKKKKQPPTCSGDVSFNFTKRNGLKRPSKNKFKYYPPPPCFLFGRNQTLSLIIDNSSNKIMHFY